MTEKKVRQILKGKGALIQKKYSQLAQEGNLWEINKLSHQTGIAPQFSDQEISILYFSSAKEEAWRAAYDIKQLQELERDMYGGKTPVFDNLDRKELETAVQKGYNETIVRDWKVEKQVFDELHNLTGIPVSEETVQKAIDHRFKSQNILGDYYLKKIKKATGMDLKPNLNLIQRMYRNCLIKEPLTGQSLYFWQYIAESTGIKPNEKLAQSAYRYLVRTKPHEFLRFVEFLGIKPEEEIVQETYLVLSKKFPNGENFKELEELTGIKPSEEIVHHTYSKIIKRKDMMWDSYFKSLFEQTGIMPSEELVQEGYKTCIKAGSFDDFEELYNTFKVEPSEEEMKKTLEKYLVR